MLPERRVRFELTAREPSSLNRITTITDQSSIIRFVEDNWLSGQRIGQGSFDEIANSISQMFNFNKVRSNGVLFLNPSTGEKE